MMVYDLEALPNVFTAMFSDGSCFEISWRKNEVKELVLFLSNVDELVGFNNLEYDYPLLHFIIENQHRITVEAIRHKSDQLIETPFGQGWTNRVPWYKQHVKQIDLRLIHHFDNKEKLTSLKALQFAMCLPSIEEFSAGFENCLTDSEIHELISYQRNDIKSTVALLNISKENMELRKDLESTLGSNCLSFNDGKLGGKYFEKELEKLNPGCLYHTNGDKKQTLRKPPFTIPEFTSKDVEGYNSCLPDEFHLPKKPIFNDISVSTLKRVDFKTKKQYESALNKQNKKTKHEAERNERNTKEWLKNCEKKHEKNLIAVWIPVRNILFDYLEFEHPEFKRVLELYRKHNITHTKSGFSEVRSINGFDFHFGQGGIHGSIKKSIVRSDDKHVIRDVDIKSDYAKIAIVNKLYPEHLGEKFCEVYEDVYQQRQKHEKRTSLNLAMKLALVTVFGNSINKYSVFYDPSFGMQITINGQLLVCMLAEQLMKLKDLQLIQINTDGLTIKYPREFTPWVKAVEQWWMDLTKLELETVDYQAMFIRDVNNYIGWFENGGKKRKGSFIYDAKPGELELHKDHSGLIIPKAIEAFLIQGISVEKFIHDHDNPFDFMMRGKVNKTDRLVLEVEQDPLVKVEQQSIIRFYFSKTGGELFKYMSPLPKERDLAKEENREPEDRRSAYQGSKGYTVQICNDMEDFDKDNVNFEYYINKTNETIEGFEI